MSDQTTNEAQHRDQHAAPATAERWPDDLTRNVNILLRFKEAAKQIGDLFCWCVENLKGFPPIEGDWIDEVKRRLKPATAEGEGANEADADIRDGRVESFDSMDALLTAAEGAGAGRELLAVEQEYHDLPNTWGVWSRDEAHEFMTEIFVRRRQGALIYSGFIRDGASSGFVFQLPRGHWRLADATEVDRLRLECERWRFGRSKQVEELEAENAELWRETDRLNQFCRDAHDKLTSGGIPDFPEYQNRMERRLFWMIDQLGKRATELTELRRERDEAHGTIDAMLQSLGWKGGYRMKQVEAGAWVKNKIAERKDQR